MTYEESAALMSDITFRNRIKTACLKYAEYIMNEPTNTMAHSSRLRWASETYRQPDMTAMAVQPPTVMIGQVQTDGSSITDANLQSAVEEVVNKLI